MKLRALALLLLSCTSSENLKQPAWVRVLVKASCGNTLALDADQQVWSEGGCENGPTYLWFRHRASDASAQRVHQAFDSLRNGFECLPPESVPDGTFHSPYGYLFLSEQDGGTWGRCETDGGEPFATLDAAFDGL